MIGAVSRWSAIGAACLCAARVAAAEELRSFDEWLTDSISERVQIAVGSRSTANQLETPATAANSTTLVDRTSASDLIGLALNLAGLTGSSEADGNDATSGSATLSGYALYAAATGRDPLSSEIYCRPLARNLRLLSGTVGFTDGDSDTPDAVTAGAKFGIPFYGLGDVCDTDTGGSFAKVQAALEDAVQSYGGMVVGVQNGLLEALRDARGDPSLTREALEDEIESPEGLDAVLSTLGDSTVARILDDNIDARAEGILTQTVRDAIREFEQQPRFSIEFLTTQRDGGAGDDYSVAGLLDWKVPMTKISLVLNGAWEAKDARDGDEQGGRASLALQYQLPDRDLSGPRPLSFSLAASGRWMTDVKDEYKGQLAVTIPILDGIELPISFTVANRTELVDETEVRGLMGFTVDTSRLTALIGDAGALLARP